MEHLFTYRDELLYCHHSLDHTPQPADFSIHAHEMYEIYYMIAGTGSYLVEGTRYPLHSGDLMIMREAETHTLLIDPTQPYERIAIHFSPQLIRLLDASGDLLRPFRDRPLGQLNHYTTRDFPSPHWKSAFQDFDFSSSTQVRAHVIARLFSLLPAVCDAFAIRRGDVVPGHGAKAQLVAYVNEHLFEKITAKALSKTFFVSPSQIARTFHRATGTSLKRYIGVKRLLAARAMIQRGESAGLVCTACGYDDYSAFYRAYKKQFAQSPRSDMPGKTIP